MPRPANPNALTPAQHTAAHRARVGASSIQITAETRAHLATIRARDGDATDRATVARVVREAAERGGGDG